MTANLVSNEGIFYYGKLYVSTSYKNGLQHGQEIQYDYAGGIQHKTVERTWANGIATKKIEYYDNGKVKAELVDNGWCKSFYSNGQPESKYFLKDGQMNGNYFEYHENGKLAVKAKYADGNYIDTLQAYYPNGKLLKWATYNKTGQRNGKNIAYHENGKLASEYKFVNDAYVDTARTYYQSGKLENLSVYTSNSQVPILDKEYAANGNLKLQKSNIDKENSILIEYDSVTGAKTASYGIRPAKKEDPIVRNGLYNEYYPDGSKQMEMTYLSDKRNGEYKIFDIKGKVIVSGNFKYDMMDGKWTFFYDNQWKYPESVAKASYYRDIEYSNGIPKGKVINYYITGEKQWEGNLLDIEPDVPDGYCIQYYKNGNKEKEGKYFNDGQKIGEWKFYREDGSLNNTENF